MILGLLFLAFFVFDFYLFIKDDSGWRFLFLVLALVMLFNAVKCWT